MGVPPFTPPCSVGRGQDAEVPGRGDADLGASASEVPGEVELVVAAGRGDRDAFGTLFVTHRAAAARAARGFRGVDADDLVSEAFLKVWEALRRGVRPRRFRPYLLTTLRNVAVDRARRDRQHVWAADVAEVAPRAAVIVEIGDPVVDAFELSMAAKAFASLPRRWRDILQYTSIDERPPSEVAPLLGLSANATAALACRAREGLRRSYLQAHVQTVGLNSTCSAALHILGSAARGRKKGVKRLVRHLPVCPACRSAAIEVDLVNDTVHELPVRSKPQWHR